MKIAYLGSGEFGIECLNALAKSSHNIELIVTQLPQPAGRGRPPRPTAVADWARVNSTDFVETDDVNAAATLSRIGACQADLIVVIAFGQKLGQDLINLPPKDTINIHASLLPKYRGAAPINWAIINGETETGVTIITISEQIDAGDILAWEKTEILPDENAGQLHDRLAKISAPLLLKTIDQIDKGTAVYTKQDNSEATRAPKLKKTDGFLDFSEPAQVLADKIRGLWPWPTAAAYYLSKSTHKSVRVSIAQGQVVSSSNPKHLKTGTLDDDLNVICGKNALRITKIKPAGSAVMSFHDFTNGRATLPGDSFTKIDSPNTAPEKASGENP